MSGSEREDLIREAALVRLSWKNGRTPLDSIWSEYFCQNFGKHMTVWYYNDTDFAEPVPVKQPIN